ncbi:MAG: hypothetical protein M1818_000665 [Claussenomyces sp. TS43310]|nr:MAG: hypothetical protein M1818_000665 [Claussenomyces sp. TS43310]
MASSTFQEWALLSLDKIRSLYNGDSRDRSQTLDTLNRTYIEPGGIEPIKYAQPTRRIREWGWPRRTIRRRANGIDNCKPHLHHDGSECPAFAFLHGLRSSTVDWQKHAAMASSTPGELVGAFPIDRTITSDRLQDGLQRTDQTNGALSDCRLCEFITSQQQARQTPGQKDRLMPEDWPVQEHQLHHSFETAAPDSNGASAHFQGDESLTQNPWANVSEENEASL